MWETQTPAVGMVKAKLKHQQGKRGARGQQSKADGAEEADGSEADSEMEEDAVALPPPAQLTNADPAALMPTPPLGTVPAAGGQ